MKMIPLTKGKFALVDDEDFEWLSQWNWHYHNGYAARTVRYGKRSENKKAKIYMHRMVMNAPEGVEVDHRPPGNKLDNRKCNLRLATRLQNGANLPLKTNNTSGYRGVSWHARAGKWTACVTVNGIQQYLGLWPSRRTAALAYNVGALIYFGEFARLNEVI